MRDVALLIVDMICLFDFEGGQSLGSAGVGCARAIARLRDRFDDAGAPVIYANDNFSDWQGELRDLVAACAVADGAAARIVQLLAPCAHHYHVLKPKHSAFQATALPVLLAKLGVRRVVIVGLAADACVLATAQDANMRELEIWVPRDAIAAQSPQRKVHAMAVMEKSLHANTQSTRSVQGIFPV